LASRSYTLALSDDLLYVTYATDVLLSNPDSRVIRTTPPLLLSGFPRNYSIRHITVGYNFQLYCTYAINFLSVAAVLYPAAMLPPPQFHPTAAHFLPFPMFKVRESLNSNRKSNKYSLNSTDFQTPAVYNHYSPLYHQKAERIKQSLEAVVNWHLIARNPGFQSHR
jgi:hypothetical protein